MITKLPKSSAARIIEQLLHISFKNVRLAMTNEAVYYISSLKNNLWILLVILALHLPPVMHQLGRKTVIHIH